MFEKTLTDVVRGIRASKRDTGLYISQCIAEIKSEINSSDMYVKANALQKLTFLQMMGYEMSWASFATIEVMSSPRFAHKRIGYLAACQSFTQETDVILLTTNLLKKELRGAVGAGMHGVYEAGVAVNFISNIITEDLARDLLPELTNLTSHPQPYLRKKALLCLFKLFVKYPQGLRLTFARLQQCLDDPDPSVVSCAVNVVTELSDKNPKNYLHLAPAFFQLLTQSSNNWMLIKVVKLLGSLVPEEPRLARKLLEPLASIVKKTKAKSLLYEAVHTITLCLPYCRKSDGTMPPIVPDIVTLCAQTLRSYVEEADQNLKYLGLVGFGGLMKSHPRVLSAPDYRPLILACLSDQDVTIRTRALDLLTGMASRKNLMELVTQLLTHVEHASGSYKHDLVKKIVEMCSGEKYALLQDFVWYLNVLFQMGHMRGVETHADLLRAQIVDVALRVLPVRAYAVRRSMEVLLEGEGSVVSDDPYGDNGRGKNIMPEILPAVAWITGEYSDLIPEALAIDQDDDDDDEDEEFYFDGDSKGTYHAIIQALMTPSNTQKLPPNTQKVYIQAAMKVFAAAAAQKTVKNIELEASLETLCVNLPVFMASTDVEVVERSFTAMELLKSMGLTVGTFDHVPGLTPADEDDESDEGGDGDGDLLGMVAGASATAAKAAVKSVGPPRSKSLSGKIREASVTLNYLLKPTPMKPAGTKAQRKKRQSPIGVTVDLDSPVNISVIEDLIEEEESYRARSKLSMEAISFTQQSPLKVHEQTAMSSSDMPSSGSFAVGIGSDEPDSFQKPVTNVGTGLVSRQRQGDPFYLDSAPTSGAEEERDQANRFGTIQLLDSDAEDPSGGRKQKKKKQKKPKRSKSKETSQSGGGGGLMSFEDSSIPTPFSRNVEPMTVYESEEDDDDDEAHGSRAGSRKGPGKEFAGLAKVDLTTPLREDEVMPERKHRVVPERSPGEPSANTKEKKKSKKSKKKKSQNEVTNTVGDLLDLGGFGGGEEVTATAPSLAPPMTTAMTTVVPMQSTNPINNAFDDLLGLSLPAPVSTFSPLDSLGATSLSTQTMQSPKKGGKRPWMKATVKVASASGTPVVDWSKLTLAFRVYSSENGGGPSAMLVLRIQNNMDTAAVAGLTVELKGHGNVAIGTIDPGSYGESDKIGPFSCSSVESSHDIKGMLKTRDCSVPVKITLPASLHLTPEDGLSLDQVANEFSSSEWSSHSAKVEINSGMSSDSVKQMLSSLLRAAEVDGVMGSSATGTLAARSPNGDRVRVMFKIKEQSVKVDVKSTNSSLAKALASDVKRLIL
jgi:AP-3 complex subunit delta-1